MFVWAPIPEPYADMGSVEFARAWSGTRRSRCRPASASAPVGTGSCASRSIENEQRIRQAVTGLRKVLPALEST